MSEEENSPRSVVPPPWPFVEVIWEDSSSNQASWTSEDELPDEAIIVSRGWLVKKTKRSVKLAASMANWGDPKKWEFGEVVTIPHSAIIKQTQL